jgi:hypothetical protein
MTPAKLPLHDSVEEWSLCFGFAVCFLGVAFLVVFPRQLIRSGSTLALICHSFLLVLAMITFAVLSIYHRRIKGRRKNQG